MKLKKNAKVEEKLICCFKSDRYLVNFDLSAPKYIKFELLTYRGTMVQRIYVMVMKNDAKFEEELSCCLKIDMMNLTHFNSSTQKSQNLPLNVLLFNKLYNVWAKKVQKIYVWWHWSLMQNFNENWLVLSKMLWGLWQFFTGWKVAISF